MNTKLTIAAIAVGLSVNPAALAASSSASAKLNKEIQKISMQTQQLQREIRGLKTQVRQLKSKKKTETHAKIEKDSNRYTKGVTVTTSPFLGVRSTFDPFDLMSLLPSANEDLRFLKQKMRLAKEAKKTDVPYPGRPLIEISGALEGQVFGTKGYTGPMSSDVNLTRAEFDTLAMISNWVTGFMSFAYDDAPPATGARHTNSRLFLNRGFLTIGDLNRFPVYFTLGQMVVPYGRFASNMVTTPVTVSLSETIQRAVLLGFYKSGFSGSVYGFKGDSNVNSAGINQYGFNLGYVYNQGSFTSDSAVGYIANVADSDGMQDTGGSGFAGFGEGGETAEKLVRRVPGVNIHTTLGYGPFTLIAEYFTATRSFAKQNLSFNDRGAIPSAYNSELSYKFKVVNRPTSIAIGYEGTSDALALNLPRHSYMTVLNASIWKDTIESLEYRYDVNYPKTDFASGNGASTPVSSVGSVQNIITAQIGVYF